jgi:hypothetical protein
MVRKKPLIYVYDLPRTMTTANLPVPNGPYCFHRSYKKNNIPEVRKP